jgi:ANTAR domain-containing protein
MSASDGATVASASNEQQRITDAVQAIVDRRAVIEQAKGMLMFVYGIDADQAFDVLRLQSQEHNVKLRLVAEQILKDLVELSRTKSPQRQLAFGGLLTVANERIASGAVRQLDGQCKTGVPMRELN